MVVLPPKYKRQAGRPKMTRIPSRGEGVRRKKCGRCGETGHTRITCSNPPIDSSISSNRVGDEAGSSKRRRIVHCSYCNEEGHTIRKCPTKVANVLEMSQESVHI